MNSFKKYQVQKGDTIESIADKIGIPAAEVRAYHNRHCKISDLVEMRLPLRHIEYILLPTLESYVDSKLSEKDTIKPVFRNSENKLRLLSINDLKLEYGTIIHYRENNQLKNKVHFTSQIEFVKEIDNHFIVTLQINEVYINNREPDLVMEKLADKISKALYPVMLCLNVKGEIHDVINIEEIQKRWKLIKPSLLQYYKGGVVVEKLIASFEKNISSAPLLQRSLKQHPFYQVYFSPLYQTYSSDLSVTYDDFDLKTFQHLDQFQTSTGKICLRRSCLSLNKSSLMENTHIDWNEAVFQIGKLPHGVDKNIHLHYKLHPNTKTIFSVTGFINSRKNTETISSTEFETYEIINKKQKSEMVNPISSKIDWSAEIINKNEIKQKGFWESFWGS